MRFKMFDFVVFNVAADKNIVCVCRIILHIYYKKLLLGISDTHKCIIYFKCEGLGLKYKFKTDIMKHSIITSVVLMQMKEFTER